MPTKFGVAEGLTFRPINNNWLAIVSHRRQMIPPRSDFYQLLIWYHDSRGRNRN